MKRGWKQGLWARVALCAALVAGLVAAGGATASAACESVWIEAYDVDVEVERRKYSVGDTVGVHGTVTRKDTGAPVGGAWFVVIVPFRKTLLIEYSETDAAGRADVGIKLSKGDVEPGWAKLRAVAYYEVADVASCAQVTEYGEKRLRRAFFIEP